jgi:hypothetical protein
MAAPPSGSAFAHDGRELLRPQQDERPQPANADAGVTAAANASTRPSNRWRPPGSWVAARTTNVRMATARQIRSRPGPQQHALRRQLPREVAQPRAQGEADGELAAPRHARGEQQVRDVRAGDQQHQEDRAQQNLQRRSHVADDHLGVRADVDAVVVAELAREHVAQLAHLQVLASFWMLFVFAVFYFYFSDRRSRWLVLFAVATAFQGFTNGYYFLFFFVLVVFWVLWFVL